MRTLSLIFGLLACVLGLSLHGHAKAAETVRVIVLRDNGIGSSAQAQPYVDKFVALAAKANGWSAADGKYATRRSQAKKYIKKSKPQFGILSLGSFLELRKPQGLVVLGYADVAHAGGRVYHLISKNATSVGGCKGNKLATNHADDKRFVDKVVAAGAFKLADFDVVPGARENQPHTAPPVT